MHRDPPIDWISLYEKSLTAFPSRSLMSEFHTLSLSAVEEEGFKPLRKVC